MSKLLDVDAIPFQMGSSYSPIGFGSEAGTVNRHNSKLNAYAILDQLLFLEGKRVHFDQAKHGQKCYRLQHEP